MGYQIIFSYDLESAKTSNLTVNGAENSCISDIDIQEFDQNIPLNHDVLTKHFLSNNTVQEKVVLRSKITLNTWKPPKIMVI
ncbi:MAG: hypothetical protein Q8S44_10775 [Flavobacteriaceae bacterium]|nr:hypothetical protein [Flavobacteriaceae bacterium]